MPKFITPWLVGSARVPATDITIEGAPYAFTAGQRYLRHTSSALSLIDILAGFLAAELVGGDAFIAKDRRVRIVSSNGAFALNWPTSIAALFGFQGNLSGAEDYTAPSVSPLLWSPSKPETPQESPLGTLGRRAYDTRFGTSPDSYQVADSHHTQIVQTFSWSYVPTDRFQTVAQDTGATGTIQGEYTRFYDTVLRNAEKFWMYRGMAEDTASGDEVTWTAGPLGPYGFRPGRGALSPDFSRSSGFKDVERRCNVSLDCLVVPEWGA